MIRRYIVDALIDYAGVVRTLDYRAKHADHGKKKATLINRAAHWRSMAADIRSISTNEEIELFYLLRRNRRARQL